MEKRFCDLCKEEIHPYDKKFSFAYGEAGIMNRMKMKSGEICTSCCKEVDKFVQKMKK